MAATSAKEAAMKALQYYRDISGDDEAKCTVEEVELTQTRDGIDAWKITLGLDDPMTRAFGISGIGGLGGARRNFKVFLIDRADGEVLSMKIRTFGRTKP